MVKGGGVWKNGQSADTTYQGGIPLNPSGNLQKAATIQHYHLYKYIHKVLRTKSTKIAIHGKQEEYNDDLGLKKIAAFDEKDIQNEKYTTPVLRKRFGPSQHVPQNSKTQKD